MRGVFEFDIEGNRVGFKFGTSAMEKACALEKCTVSELYRRLGWDGSGTEANIGTSINFFYAAALSYADKKRIAVDFTREDVIDWMDEIGLEQSAEMVKESFNTPDTKKKALP